MRRAYLFGFMALILSLLLLLTTVSFAEQEQVDVPFTTGAGVSGQFSLALPTEIYAGDSGSLIIIIDLADHFDFRPVSFIAHFEAGFNEIDPSGIINVNLLKPEPVHLEWRLRTAKAGDYPGTLWIWADAGEGKDLVMAKDFQVRSKFYLGARVAYFRIAYGVMAAVAIAWLFGVFFRSRSVKSAQN
jgi:hypothetical protein